MRDWEYRSIFARILGFHTGPASDLLVDILTVLFILAFLVVYFFLLKPA